MKKKLRSWRKEQKLSQMKAAEKMGVTLRCYQKWEAGESTPTPSNLKTISKKTGITIEELREDFGIKDYQRRKKKISGVNLVQFVLLVVMYMGMGGLAYRHISALWICAVSMMLFVALDELKKRAIYEKMTSYVRRKINEKKHT